MTSPSPRRDPEAHRYIRLGDYLVPPRGAGTIMDLVCPSKIKVDEKKKSGKSSQVITRQGKEAAKGSFKVQFLSVDWDAATSEIEHTLDLIDPNGPNKGGPFSFSYPGLGPGAPELVQITSVSRPPKWNGDLGEVTVEYAETSLPVQTATGGTAASTGGFTAEEHTDNPGSETTTPTQAEGDSSKVLGIGDIFKNVEEALKKKQADLEKDKPGAVYTTGASAPSSAP